MSLTSNDDYKMILLDAIPKLNYCKKMIGGEGVAYFLSDEFVVKRYVGIENWREFDSAFDNFCKEMQDMALITGFPKIYTWIKIPNIEYYTKKKNNHYNYFILEERIKGRDLYCEIYDEAYDLVKNVCSFEEFSSMIQYPSDCFSLFKKFVELYIEDYIKMNEFLESLSEQEIAKFVVELFNVDKDCKFLYSDLHPSNIIVSEGKLRPIDPMVDYFGKDERTSDKIKDFFANKILSLFWSNQMCSDKSIIDYFGRYGDCVDFAGQFHDLQKKNMSICKAVMLKFIKIMNKYCDNPKFISISKFEERHRELNDIFMGDMSSIQEIENELNLSF